MSKRWIIVRGVALGGCSRSPRGWPTFKREIRYMLDPVSRAIAALTYDEIDVYDAASDKRLEVPLLDRSIANDLRRIESALGPVAGKTLLFAIAAAIDEALLALEELNWRE